MVAFDLDRSIESASSRLVRPSAHKRRLSRMDPRVEKKLRRLLRVPDRPSIRDVRAELQRFCKQRRLRTPSRATIYDAILRVPPRVYSIPDLPAHVRDALYNLDPRGTVPGHQLAFYAFQYGDTRAMSFAAGLPWLELVQADKMRGWRPRSRGLLRAVLAYRKLT